MKEIKKEEFLKNYNNFFYFLSSARSYSLEGYIITIYIYIYVFIYLFSFCCFIKNNFKRKIKYYYNVNCIKKKKKRREFIILIVIIIKQIVKTSYVYIYICAHLLINKKSWPDYINLLLLLLLLYFLTKNEVLKFFEIHISIIHFISMYIIFNHFLLLL
jgi:hypothetical protein